MGWKMLGPVNDVVYGITTPQTDKVGVPAYVPKHEDYGGEGSLKPERREYRVRFPRRNADVSRNNNTI